MTNKIENVSKHSLIFNLEKVNVFVSRSLDSVGRSLSLRHAAATTMYAVKQCNCIEDRTIYSFRKKNIFFITVYRFPTKDHFAVALFLFVIGLCTLTNARILIFNHDRRHVLVMHLRFENFWKFLEWRLGRDRNLGHDL